MNTMTGKERIIRAINHREPDRVPVDLGSVSTTSIVACAYERLKEHLGIQAGTQVVSRMLQFVRVDEKVLLHFGADCRGVYYRRSGSRRDSEAVDDGYVDEWGIELRRPDGGYYYDIVKHPLREASVEDLERYPWPDFSQPERYQGIEEEAEKLAEAGRYAIIGPGIDTSIFEQAWYLRGLEQFMVDLILNPEFAQSLLERILDLQKVLYGNYLKRVGKYLDVVYYADDLASQNGPLMSPELYRQMVKPYQKELIKFIKERTDAKLFYHSCGDVLPLIADFIEMGVDILNPVQVSAREMDTQVLKEKYGSKLVFWGAIDTQRILPKGSEQEVRQEVRKRIDDLAPGGGYVLAAVHTIQPDVPPANVVTMLAEAREYGSNFYRSNGR